MNWLNMATSVEVHGLDEVAVEVALWNFRCRHSLSPQHGLLNILGRWQHPRRHTAALLSLVAREWDQEKALLTAGTLLEGLPQAESLDLCSLTVVHHGPNWAYPRRHHLHPVAIADWTFPDNRSLDPSFDDCSDYSDLEVMDTNCLGRLVSHCLGRLVSHCLGRLVSHCLGRLVSQCSGRLVSHYLRRLVSHCLGIPVIMTSLLIAKYLLLILSCLLLSN